MRIFNKKGQNTAEYAILIALVIGAAIGIQTYVKRGIQGRVKDGSDNIITQINGADWDNLSKVAVGDAKDFQQYEPKEYSAQTTSDVTQDQSTYDLYKEGTTNRTINKTAQGAVGDYKKTEKVK